MATSKNAKIEFESGHTFNDFSVMTDSGDHIVHTISGGTIFSERSGFDTIIRPNGIVTGRNIVSPSGTVDTVSVAAFTAYSKGILHSVAAATMAITRPSTNPYKISSVTMDSDGALAEVGGTEGSSFSTVRDAAGGPPTIPIDSVEIAQVKMAATDGAVFDLTEIFQVVGTHAERFDYPGWTVKSLGDGDKAEVSAKKNAYIEFDSVLDVIHGDTAADTAKQVYCQYYAPIFVALSAAVDFVPSENSHSTTSKQVYSKTIGSVSSSLGQGAFTALMTDNITDAFLQEQDQNVIIKYHPDRNKLPYILTQGTLGIKRTFPVADQNQAACTISSENASVNFSS